MEETSYHTAKESLAVCYLYVVSRRRGREVSVDWKRVILESRVNCIIHCHRQSMIAISMKVEYLVLVKLGVLSTKGATPDKKEIAQQVDSVLKRVNMNYSGTGSCADRPYA